VWLGGDPAPAFAHPTGSGEINMPQSDDARVNQIHNHPEQAANRAGASHDQKTHLTSQESERKAEEHRRQQHNSSGPSANPTTKK